jgi:hypothetical protein
MMGIYIKGMVMPYGCANCDFVSEPIYDAKGRAIYVCNAPVEEVSGKENTDGVLALYDGASEAFPDWCPLVEVPEPHGDLVDRNILEQELRNGIKAGNLEEGYEHYANINNIDDCVECVRYADTVIEAEGE